MTMRAIAGIEVAEGVAEDVDNDVAEDQGSPAAAAAERSASTRGTSAAMVKVKAPKGKVAASEAEEAVAVAEESAVAEAAGKDAADVSLTTRRNVCIISEVVSGSSSLVTYPAAC